MWPGTIEIGYFVGLNHDFYMSEKKKNMKTDALTKRNHDIMGYILGY
jgi:hypothetical protein